MKKLFMLLAAIFLLAIMACSGGGSDSGGGDDSSNSSQPSGKATGAWKGSYNSTVSGTKTMTFSIQQNDNDLTGTFYSSTGAYGSISGSVSGNDVSFTMTITNPGCSGSFSGTGIINTQNNLTTMSFQYSGSSTCGGSESVTANLEKQASSDTGGSTGSWEKIGAGKHFDESKNFTIPVANITVDGNSSDWQNIPVCIQNYISSDDNFDNNSLPHFDYIKFALNQQKNKFYVLLKPAIGVDITDKINFLTSITLQFQEWIDNQHIGSGSTNAISISYHTTWHDGGYMRHWGANISGNAPGQIEGTISTSTDCVEVSFDISSINLPEDFDVMGEEHGGDYFAYNGIIHM